MTWRRPWASAAALFGVLAAVPGILAQNPPPTPAITAAQGFFAVGNALPGATSVTVGVPGFNLVLTGTNFVQGAAAPGSLVQWLSSTGTCPDPNLAPNCLLATVVASSTSLSATVTPALVATVDTGARVVVLNQTVQSNSFPFPVVRAPYAPGGPAETVTLPAGTVNLPYSTAFVAGGVPPYQISLVESNYPPGLSSTNTGILTGTPTTVGFFGFFARFSDVWTIGSSQFYQVTIGLGVSPATLPLGEVGALYSQTLTGVGGFAPYTFSLSSGTLPPGVNLTPSGTLTGIPLVAGVYSFVIALGDSEEDTGSVPLTIQVIPTVQIVTSTLPQVVPPAAYFAQLIATGGQIPYTWTVVSGSLPPGLVLNAAGLISGTPDISSTSTTFTAQVRDALGGTAQKAITIGAVIAGPVVQTSSPLPSGTVGLNYSQVLSATGGTPGYQWTVDSGNLPPGLTLSAAGTLAGVPTAAGTFQFTVRVTDSGQRFGVKILSVVINPAPVSITTSTLPDTQGGAVSITFVAAGGVPPYTWTQVSGSLPPGLTLSPGGVLSGTTDAAGTFSFRIQVADSKGGTAAKDFSLRITAATLAITSTSPLPSGRVGVPYSTVLSAFGGVKPYAWSATGLPDGLALDSGSGTLSGTPGKDGTFRVAVQVTDSAGSNASATLSLDIAPPPLAITSGPRLPDATAGVAYSATVNASGGTSPYNWQVALGSLPSGLVMASTGTIAGTTLATGTSVFTLTVSDARGSIARQEFTLVVQQRPLTVLTTSLPAGTVGQAYSQTASAAGGTPPYTWSGALPAGLSIDRNSGAISGTPTTSGRLNCTLTAADSAGASASSSFLVNFALPTLPPVSVGGPDTSDAGKQAQVQVTLAAPYPVRVNGTATLTFRADTGGDDPAVQFAADGRSATYTFAPNSTTSDPPALALQTGTVAGLITVASRLVAADGTDVTPSPAPSRQVRVNAGPPVISSVTATRNATGLQVQVAGFSPTRSVTQAVFHFTAAAGGTLQGSDVTIPVDAVFAAWYQSAASSAFGSQFLFTQPFTLQGSAANVASVSVTLSNQLGNSQPVSATVQ